MILGCKFYKSGSELDLLTGSRIAILTLVFCVVGCLGGKLRWNNLKLMDKGDWLYWDSLRFMTCHQTGLWWAGEGL